jgi:hypothetical protein
MKNRRALATLAAILSLGAIGVGLTNSAQAAETKASGTAQVALSSDFIKIVNDHAGKCADVTNSSTAPGALIQEWDCTGAAAQAFRPIDLGNGFFQLVNRNSALCMVVENPTGDRAHQQFCNSAVTGQWWRWEVANNTGALDLASGLSGQCLHLVPNTSKNGTAIATRACSSTDSANLWHAESA